jgi:hypothetical protein
MSQGEGRCQVGQEMRVKRKQESAEKTLGDVADRSDRRMGEKPVDLVRARIVRDLGFTRVHITSCAPRSGTTLLVELMTHGFHFDACAEHELSLFCRPRDARGTVLTKAPVDIINARLLLNWWRDLWLICMVRDPRDVVVSRHRRAAESYYVGLGTWREGYGHARRMRAHPRVLELRYEDLTADPHGAQERIRRWMPQLERRAAFSDFHREANPCAASLDALGGLRPISGASVGAWRRHKPRLATQLARHGPIDQTLIELGYEADSRWLSELEGVEPDGLPSHIPEFPTVAARLGRESWRLRNTIRSALGLAPEAPVVLPRGGSRSADDPAA